MAEDKTKKDAKAEEPKKEGEAAVAEGAEGAAPAKSKKKKLIIIIGGAVVLIGVIVGGLFAAGVLGGGKAEGKKTEKAAEGKDGAPENCGAAPAEGKKDEKKDDKAPDPCKPVYVEVPDLIVNLSSESRRAHFVNLKLTLELKSAADSEFVNANMPRVVDSFNTYLREMTKEDLEGSEGLIRLEDEMMLRLNKVLKPGQVTDILFRSVIVQ